MPYGLGAVTASTRGRKRAHAMPNVLASCASVSLFTFRHVHAARRYTTSHIVHARLAPTPRRSCRWLQLWGHTCSIFRSHRTAPHEEGTHKRTLPPVPLSQDGFLREAMLFFKSMFEPSSKGLFFCISMIRRGDPKVNNQF